MTFRSRTFRGKCGFFLSLSGAIPTTSCQIQDPQVSPEKHSPRTPINSPKTNPYIGLNKGSALAAARQQNTPVRIVREDGQLYPVTKDLRPGRLNLELDNGRVSSAKFY